MFKLRGTRGQTRITDTTIEVENSCLSESKSRNYYIFDVGSTQPVYYRNNLVMMSSRHGRMFVFGSDRSCDSVALQISNSTFTNRTPENPLVGVVANLWTRTQRTDLFGSIAIDSVIGNSVMPYWFDDPQRSWPQNLSISNSIFNAAGTSTPEIAPIVNIVQPPNSTWQLTITNCRFTSRNTIPIIIESVVARNAIFNNNANNIVNNVANAINSLVTGATTLPTNNEYFTLNVANSFFWNLEVPSVGAVPWLQVTGLANFTLNVDAGSSMKNFNTPSYVSVGTFTQNVNPSLI